MLQALIQSRRVRFQLARQTDGSLLPDEALQGNNRRAVQGGGTLALIEIEIGAALDGAWE